MVLAFLFNPFALLARLVGALLHGLAPQTTTQPGVPSMADIISFEERSRGAS